MLRLPIEGGVELKAREVWPAVVDGSLGFRLTELAGAPSAAVVVEERYAQPADWGPKMRALRIRYTRALFRAAGPATLPDVGKARIRKGRRYQGETPDWGPLLDAVGERVTGDFMWMFEVVMDDGTPLQAYKHIDTRRYVHLAPDGAAFFYEEPDRYRSIATARVLAEVFAPLPGLVGVTDEQISESWAAVERLKRVRTPSDV